MQNNEKKRKVNATMNDNVKYLNPKADLTFKLVFGEHPDLVKSLLNALLPLNPDELITHVEYITPEMVPENPAKKNSVVDVRCYDQMGRQFIVEMQMEWNESFKKRVVLNASKAVVRQLKKREDFKLVHPVYSLNLINDIGFDAGPDEFYHDYAIVNVEHTDRIIEGLRFVFIELPKFVNKREQSDACIGSVEREQTRPKVKFKPKTMAEKKMAVLWLRFLTEISEQTSEVPAELLENAEISKALSIVEKSAFSDAQLYAYEQFWDAVYVEKALIEGGYEKGLAEGEEKGEAKGRTKERLANAKALLENNVPLEVIVKSLGLTDQEAAALRS